MAFVFLGIIVFALSVYAAKSDLAKKYAAGLKFAAIAMVLLGVSLSCFKQINPGYVGVKVLFGKVHTDVLESGLHFINPLLDVKDMDIKTQNYTMSMVHDEGDVTGDDAIRILTADGLEVAIDLTVLYKVTPSDAPKILNETGLDYNSKIVRPITRTAIRDNAVYYEAVALYSTKRDEFQNRIFSTIEKSFKTRGIILEQLLIRNVTLPTSVKASIESKINAEQDAQKCNLSCKRNAKRQSASALRRKGLQITRKLLAAA
jgi:regulator of protease activity HflC (stomatin/prohibitin superfamily)